MGEQTGRIPSLDGLRAISIGMVIIGHLSGTQNFPVPLEVTSLFEPGQLGVRVFFVISGFLITHLLLQELDAKGHIHLGKFYLRRTLRIFPPYYVFLAALALLQAWDWVRLAPRDMLHGATYTSNYYDERSWYVGHTWSLAVEEQFYLLWPAMLFVAGKGRGLWAAFSVILASPLIRIGLLYLGTGVVGHRFETVADSIAVGCVMAVTHEWLHGRRLYQNVLGSKWFVLAPFGVLFVSLFHEHARPYMLVGYTIMNVGIAASIDWCVTYHSGKVGKFLNSRPLVFIGVTSYSIYLWQQLFLNRYSASAVSTFPFNFALTVTASLASYYFVERPSLRMRHWLEAKIFAPRKAPAADPANRQVRASPDAGRGLSERAAMERGEAGAGGGIVPAVEDSGLQSQ